MSVPVIAAVLIFMTFCLGLFGVFSLLRSRKTRQEWRQRAEGAGSGGIPERSSPGGKQVPKFLKTVGEVAKPQNEDELSRLRRTLSKAGYRRVEAPIVFYGVKLCSAMLLPIVFAVLRVFVLRTLPHSYTLLLFVLLGLVGFYMPNLWIQLKIRSRKQKIAEGFPDALDLMVVCVESGLGLDAAMLRVGEELQLTNKVLSEEFRLLNLGLRAGQSRQTALRNLSLRTGLEDVNNLVTLLIQTDKFGTSIAQTLRVHSDSMRTKRFQRAEELAAKIPVKILIPLIFFIFPSLFIAILGSAVVQIANILLPTLAGTGN